MMAYTKENAVYGTSLHMITNKKLRKNNTSGVTGVYKSGYGYVAYIAFQKKTYYLGYFSEFNEAVEARKAAEVKLHDSFVDWYYKTHPEKRK